MVTGESEKNSISSSNNIKIMS